MRPNRSLFVPVLLILLGTLLLIRNFRPEFPFWNIVARYWPVVLLVWGLAKLAGALRKPAPGAPAWRPSLSVGEFFLALFIVVVGLSASKWVEVRHEIPWGQIDIDWPWGEHFTYTEEVKRDMPANASIYFENYAGDVRVAGTDTRQLTVTVTKQVRSTSEADARKLANSVHPEIVQDGTALTVRLPSNPQFRADLQVSVPKNTPIRFDLKRGSAQASDIVGDITGNVERGDAAVSNIEGNVRLQLRGGSLNAQGVKGNVELEGRGGDVQVSDVSGQLLIRGDYAGASDYANIGQGVKVSSTRTDMEIQKLPGRVEMTLGSLAIRQPNGAVTVSTRNKDVTVEDFDERLQVQNRGGSVELSTTRLPLKDIEVENHSGPIELTLPAGSEFQVDAVAQRGDVESDFGPMEAQTANGNGVLSGRFGKGGANVKLNTSYASIRIRKAGSGVESAAPPKPPKAPKAPKGKLVMAPGSHAFAWSSSDSHNERLYRIQQRQRERLAEVQRRAAERIAETERRGVRIQ